MAAAATTENKIKDLLLGQDVAGQVELLLNLLSDAAAGKELSNVLSDVIQVSSSQDGRIDLLGGFCQALPAPTLKAPATETPARHPTPSTTSSSCQQMFLPHPPPNNS